jgi:hypothetical protein
VKTWRRLQQIGAVQTKNSVYVLPNNDQCREDFEWIRSEIATLGGEATLFAAEALHSDGDELIVAFQRARDTEYRGLKKDADRMLSVARAKRRLPAANREEWRRSVRRLRDRFAAIERTDFFRARAGQEALGAISALERLAASSKETVAADGPVIAPAAFKGRRWVTRPRPGVDRMASAWLIRRFIDPMANFGFVEQPADQDVPFDMYTGEFSHHGTSCTFETLVQRFGITDPGVSRIGQIVHDLDMKERRYVPLEAPAVERMVEGLQTLYPDDETLLQQGMVMFEALARSFGAKESTTSSPARPARSKKGARR